MSPISGWALVDKATDIGGPGGISSKINNALIRSGRASDSFGQTEELLP